MENYQKVELWKQRGFISENLDADMQIKLAGNLQFAKDIVSAKKFLSDDFDFYHEVELLLYPITVYYTTINNDIYYKGKSIFHLFIDFCEKNLKIKNNYDLKKYNEDYRLVTDFIAAHPIEEKFFEQIKMSPEWNEMVTEYKNVADGLLTKYGPQGAHEITKILDRLIDEDIQAGMQLNITDF